MFGGAGLKIIEVILGRGEKKDDLATNLRTELRQDLATIKADLKAEAQAADEWQKKYWELKASTLIANTKVDAVIKTVDEEHPGRQLKKDLEPLMDTDK